MKPRFLFPHWSRYIGYLCIVGHIPIMHMRHLDDFGRSRTGTSDLSLFSSEHLYFMSTVLLMLIGLLLVAFSKERIEDEQISRLRLDSLQWAVYLNYVLLIISLVFFNMENLPYIVHFNVWVPLVFFIVRFRWVIYRLNQSAHP
jgi:hypothetical protein